MQAEAVDVGAQVLLEVRIPGHPALHRQHLSAGPRTEGDAVSTGRRLQRPERAGFVGIAVVVRHVSRSLLLDQHPPAGEQTHQSGDDLVQHRLQRFIGWRQYLNEPRRAVDTLSVHAVQHQAVKVDVQVGSRAKALDERDCAAVGPSSALRPDGPSRWRVITRCTTCSTGVTSLGCAASSRRSGMGRIRAACN